MGKTNANWVRFTQTHWTLVLTAKDPDSAERHRALESLCRAYWPPIYAYIRQQGYRQEDAQDLTQDFFRRLLEKDYLQHLTHTQGKFRSFLLTGVNHLLSDERDKRLAQKRGGGQTHISFEDFQSVDAELSRMSSDGNAEVSFDRMWAATVLKRANERLAEVYRSRGKAELFEGLNIFATGSEQQPAYETASAKLGMTEEALRAAMHRMRVKFGQIIREEVSHTLTSPEDLESEIRHLVEVMAKT